MDSILRDLEQIEALIRIIRETIKIKAEEDRLKDEFEILFSKNAKK